MATTPYMGLTLPVVSSTVGPDWATYLNAAFTAVDSHNHTSAKGLPIPTAGLGINADLTFGSYNATALRTTRFTSQTAALALGTDVACVYVVNGDLYYNNGSGTPIKVTSGTAINASAVGGIGGDYVTSGASVFYTSATKLFSFQSVTTPAGSIVWSSLGTGPLVIHDTAAGVVNAITLKSPAALAASYSVTLPAALPGSTLPLQISSAGVATLGQITTAQITDLNVTRGKQAAVGQQVSTSCGAYSLTGTLVSTPITNLTVTITTTGRPVMLRVQSTGTAGTTTLQGGAAGCIAYCKTLRATSVLSSEYRSVGAGATVYWGKWAFDHMDVVAAGTYTYTCEVQLSDAGGTFSISNAVLVAYEL